MRLVVACLVTLGALVGLSTSPAAHGQDDPQTPKIVRLSLSPAAEPQPALKYEILPTALEQTVGNAAPHYYRAVVSLRSRQEQAIQDESKLMVEFPDLETAPRERLQNWVNAHQRSFDEIARASRCETCDWELRLQDLRGPEAVSFLLEEFQQLRSVYRPLNMRTRLQIQDGRLDDAFAGIRLQYQTGRHVSMQPNLICGLVGVAFVSLANERVEQWIGAPNSPNLYWAIATLPRPLVSLRPAMDQERALPWRLFPFLADAETATRSKEEWQRVLVDAMQLTSVLDSNSQGKPSELQAQAMVLSMVSRGYSQAKRELLEAGFDRDRLEAMPVGQVVTIWMARDLRSTYDRWIKAFYLPYPHAVAWAERAQRDFSQRRSADRAKQGAPLIADILLPAISQVLLAEARVERQLAALQTIEAIRLHQAANQGRLPQSLDEITVVPVPLNPVTSKPFFYAPPRPETDGAILEVPAAIGEPPAVGRRYVLKAR